MANREEFDVIIIGSGVSGLVCGCYLQKAGLKVAIFEAAEEAGGGRKTVELTRPGYFVSPNAWGEMDTFFMHNLNLDLDRYGYQEQEFIAPWGWGHVFSDGTCLVSNSFDHHKTIDKIRRFSEKDSKTALAIGDYLAEPFDNEVSRVVKFIELIFAEPWTWENFDILINLVGPLFPFKDPYEITDLNGFEMLDLLWESEKVKLFCSGYTQGMSLYNLATGGSCLLNLIPVLAVTFSHPKRGTHTMAHIYIRCFRALGGKLFNSSSVSKIIVAGGEAKGVILGEDAASPGKEVTAKRIISNLNPRLTFTELVGEEHVGKKIIQQLKTNFKGETVLVTVSFSLKERPRWAAEKYDPDIEHSICGFFNGTTLQEMIHCIGERMAGRFPEKSIITY